LAQIGINPGQAVLRRCYFMPKNTPSKAVETAEANARAGYPGLKRRG
jgi:hypothetical protein